MQVLSDLPFSVESVPSAGYPPPRLEEQPLNRECTGDEEFPADLPVKYDWFLQPASRRGFRRAVRILVATVTLLSFGLLLWGVYKFPMLTLVLGIALAVVVIAAAIWMVFSVIGGLRSEPSWSDLRRPTFHLKS